MVRFLKAVVVWFMAFLCPRCGWQAVLRGSLVPRRHFPAANARPLRPLGVPKEVCGVIAWRRRRGRRGRANSHGSRASRGVVCLLGGSQAVEPPDAAAPRARAGNPSNRPFLAEHAAVVVAHRRGWITPMVSNPGPMFWNAELWNALRVAMHQLTVWTDSYRWRSALTATRFKRRKP